VYLKVLYNILIKSIEYFFCIENSRVFKAKVIDKIASKGIKSIVPILVKFKVGQYCRLLQF